MGKHVIGRLYQTNGAIAAIDNHSGTLVVGLQLARYRQIVRWPCRNVQEAIDHSQSEGVCHARAVNLAWVERTVNCRLRKKQGRPAVLVEFK